MQWNLLGPLEVLESGRPVNLGGRQRRTLLALLLINTGAPVSTDRLIFELWGDRPPESARKTVQANVAHLRRALNTDEEFLVSAASGYALRVSSDETDAGKFERLVQQARGAMSDDPDWAVETLDQALGLFRGAPLADLADDSFSLKVEASRLDDARVAAIEDRIEALITANESAKAAIDAERHIAEHPTRERLWALLMHALYNSGRQAEALGAYSRLRLTLAEELGIEPSLELQHLEQRILDHDAKLGVQPLVSTPGRKHKTVRNPFKGLRPFDEADSGDFFGRDDLIRRLMERVNSHPPARFTVLAGPSGAGKSSVLRAGIVPQLRSGSRGVAVMVPGQNPHEGLQHALGEEDVTSNIVVVDQFEELFTQTPQEASESFLDLVADDSSPNVWVVAVRADFLGRLLAHRKLGALLDEALILVPPMQQHEIEAVIVGPCERVGVQAAPELVQQLVRDVQSRPSSLPLLQFALTDAFERRRGGVLSTMDYEHSGGISGAVARRAEQVYAGLDSVQQAAARQLLIQLVTVTEEGDVARKRARREELLDLPTTGNMASLIEKFGAQRLLTFDQDTTSGGSTVDLAHEALISEWPRYRDWVQAARDDLRMSRRLATAAAEWEEGQRDPSFLLTGSRYQEMASWRARSSVEIVRDLSVYLSESERSVDAETKRRRTRRRLISSVLGFATLVSIGLSIWAINQANVSSARALPAAAMSVLDSDPELGILLAMQSIQDGPAQALGEAEGALHAAIQAHRTILRAEAIEAVAISPDGSLFTGGNLDGPIQLWSTTTGGLVSTIAGFDHGFYEIAWSPNGSLIAAIGHDFPIVQASAPANQLGRGFQRARLRVWDTNGGALLTEKSFPGAPQKLTFSPDSRWLGVSFWSGNPSLSGVMVFDLTSPGEGASFIPVPFPLGLDFGPDGLLAVTSNAPSGQPLEAPFSGIAIWDINSMSQVGSISGEAVDVAFADDGSAIVVTGDATSHVYSGTNFEPLFDLVGHTNPTTSASFDALGTRIATSSVDGTVRIFSSDDGTPVLTLAGHNSAVLDVALSSRGDVAASVGNDGSLRVWDVTVSGGSEVARVVGAASDFDPDEGRLFVTGANGISLVQPDGQVEVISTAESTGATRTIRFSHDGDLLLTTRGGAIDLFDVDPFERLHHWQFDYDILGVSFRSDGNVIHVRGERQFARIDTESGAISGGGSYAQYTTDRYVGVNVIGMPDSEWSPVGHVVAEAGTDGWLAIRREESHESDLIWLFRNAHTNQDGLGHATQLDFSPDGLKLASVGLDGLIKVWDIVGGPDDYTNIAGENSELLLQTLGPGGGESLVSVDFSPDGLSLAVGSADGEVSIWDLQHGVRRVVVARLSGLAHTVQFSPDGRRLAVGLSDPDSNAVNGTISVYLLDVDELVALARSRLTRWWTAEECRTYLQSDTCPSLPLELAHFAQKGDS